MTQRVLSFLSLMFLAIVISYYVYSLWRVEHMKESQTLIRRIKLIPRNPEPFVMKNWKELTKAYIRFVFSFNLTGKYLPLIRIDKSDSNAISFDLPSYVGDFRACEGSGEAINCIAAVLSGTLVGINMSNYNGCDWVSMCKSWFSKEDGIFLNNKKGQSGGSFWYDIYPNILIFSLTYYYPEIASSWNSTLYKVAESFYEASRIIYTGYYDSDFDFTAFDFRRMIPVNNGRWVEPDAAAGMAWLEYMAYVKWGDPRFLEAAKWNMEFLQERDINPFYEVLLPFGAYIAARMNAELGTDYDVQKLLNWCFDGETPLGPRPGWGVVIGKWGDYDVSGLVGSLTDGGGYAFAMNTFDMALPLVPLTRYNTSFAKDIGKWLLNAANNARLFYPDSLPESHQSSSSWRYGNVIAYEGLRYRWNGKSPYAMGDPVLHGWGATDLGLYGSSHVGIFGGIINPTDDDKILQIDLLKTDMYHGPAYPTYLYYNPYDVNKSVKIEVGSKPVDIYCAVTHEFLARNVTGTGVFILPPDSAKVIVLVPIGGKIEHLNGKMLVNGVVVDYEFES